MIIRKLRIKYHLFMANREHRKAYEIFQSLAEDYPNDPYFKEILEMMDKGKQMIDALKTAEKVEK